MRLQSLFITSAFIALSAAGFYAASLSGKDVQAETQQTQALTRADVEQIVAEYIADNPEQILNAVEQHMKQKQLDAQNEAAAALENEKDALFNNPSSPSIGPADADVVIAEFLDYNCGFCKKALPEVLKLVGEDPNVRVVFKEMPILSESSRMASKYALAAHKQDRYFEYHTALMEFKGQKTEASLLRMAEELGLDTAQLKLDAEAEDIAKQLNENMVLARRLGISGTPGFVVNNEILRGYLPYDRMKVVVAQERAKLEEQ